MESKKSDGCAIGCGLLAGLVVMDYLLVVGSIALICWCFGPIGIEFDIRIATGCWIILHIIYYLFKKLEKFIKSLRS